MSTTEIVMTIEKPHFIVKLHKTLLEVDLKEGIRKDLETALEKHGKIRESLGLLFQTIVPLDVPLRKIDSVSVTENGHVKVVIPLRRDIHIPLDPDEARRLVDKLNELIPIEKQRAFEEEQTQEKTLKELDSRSKTAQDEEEDVYRSRRML
jgi:hypothetical protein